MKILLKEYLRKVTNMAQRPEGNISLQFLRGEKKIDPDRNRGNHKLNWESEEE